MTMRHAAAFIPILGLSAFLAGTGSAMAAQPCGPGAMQQNHASTRNGAQARPMEPLSTQKGNQPNTGSCQQPGRSTTATDKKHAKAAARVNHQTGAEEGAPAPLSNQKGNQPKSPVEH